jgi:hypothetical protein
VYALIDPLTNEIFYVGKGTGYRDTSHLKPSSWKDPKNTTNPFLYHKIKSLMENGTPPYVKRLQENLHEESAYQLENMLIKEYGRRFSEPSGKLFNITDSCGGSAAGKAKPWSNERRERHKILSKTKRKYDPTYDELYDDYITKNLKRSDISLKYNISDALIKKRLQDYGIYKPKTLAYPKRNVYNCVTCGNIFETPSSVKMRKYCSRKCYRNTNDNLEKSETDV